MSIVLGALSFIIPLVYVMWEEGIFNFKNLRYMAMLIVAVAVLLFGIMVVGLAVCHHRIDKEGTRGVVGKTPKENRKITQYFQH